MPVIYWGHRTLRSSGVQSVAHRLSLLKLYVVFNKFRNCTHKLGHVRLLFSKYTVRHIV